MGVFENYIPPGHMVYHHFPYSTSAILGYCMPTHIRYIWGVPEIGVAPVFIHFRLGFSNPAVGVPPLDFWKPPCRWTMDLKFFLLAILSTAVPGDSRQEIQESGWRRLRHARGATGFVQKWIYIENKNCK